MNMLIIMQPSYFTKEIFKNKKTENKNKTKNSN